MTQPRPRVFSVRRALALLCGGASLCLTAMAGDAPSESPPTNAPVHFLIRRYEVAGNTLLPTNTVDSIVAHHTGSNVTFADVAGAVKELQLEYHNRGYDTISVTVPQQRLTNGVFKIRIFEGRLADIIVTGNRFFSSNNVMRALPGLKTNMFLNSKLLQPQLDLANLNQDRQIYPEIQPGPTPDTTSLTLRVKDQLPLHGKVELNNQSTPGTPELRVATSAAYDNLWQLNHQLGVQYTFSPTDFKQGGDWNFYDQPLVANYSAFYRLPLGGPESIAGDTANSAGRFGYNEATRKFELPPPTGTPELNIFASGSTIDTGVLTGNPKILEAQTNGDTLVQEAVHQDLTYNQALGFRLTYPLQQWAGMVSHLQAGMDLKFYKEASFETNDSIFTQYFSVNNQIIKSVTVTPNPIPPTRRSLAYLPLAFHFDTSRIDPLGVTAFTINDNPNIWYSGSRQNLDALSGPGATGFWNIVTGSVSRDQDLPGTCKLALRADGQWAGEPLVANEQFGAGGVTGARGYREGEVFGDSGWRVTSEFKLPPFRVGYAGQGLSAPLITRASFFMDYADTYLIEPQGRPGATPLWGTGFAGAASLGPHFNLMLSFGWPLLSTPTTEAYHLRIAFALSAQF